MKVWTVRRPTLEALPLMLVSSLLVASTILNGLLAWQLSVLKAAQSAPRPLPGVSAGTAIRPFSARTLEGSPVTVDLRGTRPTLVYVFKPECGWCERNLANLRTLTAHAADTHRVVGLSLTSEGLADYVLQKGLTFEVYQGVEASAVRAYQLTFTPQTLVVAEDGTVQRNWPGAYRATVQKEIESYFRTVLPGLPTDTP